MTMKQENGSILLVKCISNIGYEASLTVGKTYKARADSLAPLAFGITRTNDTDIQTIFLKS